MNWTAVAELIKVNTGFDCEALEASPVYGGDINQAWRLASGKQRFFVKTNKKELLSMFEAELAGLNAMRNSHSIRVPEVIGCGLAEDFAFIVMEFLDFGGGVDDSLFARQLAAMHQYSSQYFGFEIDNTIGSTPQINTFNQDWIEFWRQYRLGYQLELAQKNRLDKGMIDRGEKLNEQVDQFFSTYQPLPSLLHGDLWSGNQSSDKDGSPIIFDPACYYGDHEADLAMMELFGRPSQRFFDAYREVFAIDAGYSVRRDLYNLYHILNHANLFGGGYVASARNIIERLLSHI